eukprot:c20282_g1_i2.p1 GENE.c20282_g1_i2~~c20282_g1_i2.p1  ORF type:complete len:139 (-),score=17.93 c20282_g1_i2:20-436(-)
MMPHPYRIHQPLPPLTHPLTEEGKAGILGDLFSGMGFGEIEIDWTKSTLTSRLIGTRNNTAIQFTSALKDFDPKHKSSQSRCVPLYGEPSPSQYALRAVLLIVWVSGLAVGIFCATWAMLRLIFSIFMRNRRRRPKEE